MSVRARMYVNTVTLAAGETGTVQLNAVTRGEINKDWAAYTPAASLTMNLSRKAGPALDWFQDRIGKEVYVDVSDVEPAE